METRVGLGFDVHKFTDEVYNNNNIKLCAIDIPFERKVIAHSDGDVVLHALVDAILGALGKGDIGYYFPPSDIKWKGCDSTVFLQYASDLVKENSGKIVNIDINIICEQPRISNYREAMMCKLSSILNLDKTRVNIKGGTTEKMGFLGRKEGIAAQAIVSICIPFPS